MAVSFELNNDDQAVQAPPEQSEEPGKTQPGRLHFDFDDTDEQAHRKRATGRHFSRWLLQFGQVSLVVIIAALAPWFWLVAQAKMGTNGTIRGVNLSDIPISLLFLTLISFAIAAGLAAYIVWLLAWYRRERDHDWRQNNAKADAREPEQSANGYMQLFRLYARTKRRAIFIMLYGIAFLWWALCGLALSAQTGFPPAGNFLYASMALQIILGIWIVYIAFDIGRRYVPGRVIVTKTLILSFLATTSQTPYQDARNQSLEIESKMIDEKPWWFYSYKKRPKVRL